MYIALRSWRPLKSSLDSRSLEYLVMRSHVPDTFVMMNRLKRKKSGLSEAFGSLEAWQKLGADEVYGR